MTDQPNRPAMTMGEIRKALGHTEPPVLVEATRYEVSVLPRSDINFRSFTLYVQRRGDGWGITDGAGWIESMQGHWTLDYYEALLLPELSATLDLARRLAPKHRVNGMTAVDAYRRTHPNA